MKQQGSPMHEPPRATGTRLSPQGRRIVLGHSCAIALLALALWFCTPYFPRPPASAIVFVPRLAAGGGAETAAFAPKDPSERVDLPLPRPGRYFLPPFICEVIPDHRREFRRSTYAAAVRAGFRRPLGVDISVRGEPAFSYLFTASTDLPARTTSLVFWNALPDFRYVARSGSAGRSRPAPPGLLTRCVSAVTVVGVMALLLVLTFRWPRRMPWLLAGGGLVCLFLWRPFAIFWPGTMGTLSSLCTIWFAAGSALLLSAIAGLFWGYNRVLWVEVIRRPSRAAPARGTTGDTHL